MADLADITGERMEVQEAADLAQIRLKAQQMEPGVPFVANDAGNLNGV